MSHRTEQSITDSRLDRELIFTNEDHYLQQRQEEEAKDRERAAAQADHNKRIFSTVPDESPNSSVDRNISTEKSPDTTPQKNSRFAIDEFEDVQRRTLRNLDTGEEYIIGENDPDFEFDTFELSYGEFSSEDESQGGKANNEHPSSRRSQQKLSKAMKDTGIVEANVKPAKISSRPALTSGAETGTDNAKKKSSTSWWKRLYEYFISKTGRSTTGSHQDSTKAAGTSRNNSLSAAVRTPFSKLSSFRFRRELGRGAFGRVFLAEVKSDGTLYAMKIISKKNMRHSDRKQAKTERDILLAMGHSDPHPFTTGLKFAFQSENNLYLGMNYIPGGTLRELIKRYGCLPEEWTRIYSAELVLAISHMHSLKMLYRDIKPHNVMIDARGHLTIIDFGLSKQDISSARGAMSLVGTPDYSAPEVLKTGVHQIETNKAKAKEDKNKKKNKNDTPTKQHVTEEEAIAANIGYGKAADWWSLGVMVYEMLSGTPAFRGTDLRHTYQRVLFSELIFTPEEKFSIDSKELLHGLLCRDPAKRLGAEENPPRDIMNAAFFSTISWEKIFACKEKGPWVPDIPKSERRKLLGYKEKKEKSKKSKKRATKDRVGEDEEDIVSKERANSFESAIPILMPDTATENSSKHLEASKPIGIVSVVQEQHLGVIGEETGSLHGRSTLGSEGTSPRVSEVVESNIAATATADHQPIQATNSVMHLKSNTGIGQEGQHSDDESSVGDSDVDSSQDSSCSQTSSTHSTDSVGVEGEIHLRDSIFQHSKAANQQNRLQDWSFFDERMLLSVSQAGATTALPPAAAEAGSSKNKSSRPMTLSGGI